MTRPLILHQITAVDADLLGFIEIAAACDCNQVSLFTFAPRVLLAALAKRGLHFPQMVTQDSKRTIMERLASHGISVSGAEFFPITADIDLDEYVPGLALSREIGAARAVTHIIDEDSARATDRLGALCDLAAAEGLAVGIEFTPTTPGCKTIQRGAWFVDQVGKSNLGLGVDSLHLVRGGGTAADVAALDARYFSNGQLCDGHGLHATSDYMTEVHNRGIPGTGDFPLHDIFSALPASAPLEVEVPFEKAKDAGISTLDHVRQAVARSRALVDGLTPHR